MITVTSPAVSLPTGLALTPCWVSRVNLYPYSNLRSADGGRQDQLLIDRLLAEHKLREDLRSTLLAALSEQIRDNPAASSKTWIPLRRDVYNLRRSSKAWGWGPEGADIPGLHDWHSSWSRTAVLQQELASLHTSALASERAALDRWSVDQDVQRATVMTSTSLYRGVKGRAGNGAQLNKRQRKSEPSLVHYFARSTTKVSPFSLYTGTLLHPMVDRSETGAGNFGYPLEVGRKSKASLRRLYVRQAARLLAQDPQDKWKVSWKLGDGVEATAEGLLIRQRKWRKPSLGMKADTFMEDVARIPATGSWPEIFTLLQEICTEPVPLKQIAEQISTRSGWSATDTEKLLESMAAMHLLVPIFPIHEQSDAYEKQWLRYLRGFTGKSAAALRQALTRTEAATGRWPEASGEDRAQMLGQLESLWAVALGLPKVDNPLVEDSYVAVGAPADDSRVASWAADFAGLAPMLVAQDDQRVLAAALEQVFTDIYGVNGRCQDLREFAQAAYAAFPLTQQLLAGQAEVTPGSPLAQLLQGRKTMAAHLVELSRSGHTPVDIDRAVLAQVADQLPSREWNLQRSISVFGQSAGENFVLNHLYGGRGRYFSRFLSDQDPQLTELIRDSMAEAVPPGARTLHMRPSLGFNANLNPLMAEEELRLTDEHAHPAARIRIEDLELVHGKNGLRVVHKTLGHDIDVLYTGFLVPHALPSEEMLLAMIAAAPYFSFSELTLDLHERLDTGNGPVVSSPRIGHGNLTLFRKRYGFTRGFLEVAASSGVRPEPADAFRELNLRRSNHDVPAEVFLRPLLGKQITPIERAMSPRPQYVDFLSRLHVEGLHKRSAKLGETLLAEEFHPHPSRFGIETARGRHCAELFFEVSLTSGASNE